MVTKEKAPASAGEPKPSSTMGELNSFFKKDGFDFHLKIAGDVADILARFIKLVTWLKDMGAEPSRPPAQTMPGEQAYFCKYHPDRKMKRREDTNRPRNWRGEWTGFFCTYNWTENGQKKWCRFQLDEQGKEEKGSEADYS